VTVRDLRNKLYRAVVRGIGMPPIREVSEGGDEMEIRTVGGITVHFTFRAEPNEEGWDNVYLDWVSYWDDGGRKSKGTIPIVIGPRQFSRWMATAKSVFKKQMAGRVMSRDIAQRELLAAVNDVMETGGGVNMVDDLLRAGKLIAGKKAETKVDRIDVAHQLVLVAKELMAAKSAPKVRIDKIPGFSPQQLRTAIDKIVAIRQQLQQIMTQYESILKQIKTLEAEEKEGLKDLKKAAAQMKQKARFLVEAEKGLLEFTAFLQEKRPGVEQMLSDPATSKWGEKAGDFFNRVGAKLGKDVQEAVELIYRETEEDLTHTSDAIRGLKIVVKTASIRKAGLADMALSVREWLAGRPDGLIRRIINFAGDVKRWLKGFVVRTRMVEKSTDGLLSALDEAKASIDTALA